MSQAYRRCCGIDVHKSTVVVHVRPPQGTDSGAGSTRERTFKTYTRTLRQLRKWLQHCRVTDIVMESTGQYWRPVWNILEDTFPGLILVNPMQVKALAGRKTDRIDAARLARFLEHRELDPSFVPPRPIRQLRDLTRGRVHLLEEINRVKNRISQLLECGNIKLGSVASDVFGVSGRRMLRALIEGQRDPGWMADSARGALRRKKKDLELALEGSLTEHQRWLLNEELTHLESLEAERGRFEAELERQMLPYQEQLQRLATIPGVDRIAAWTILAELGTDMSVFPDAAHCASWAGLCPGNNQSGGKRKSGRTRKANQYLRRILCQCVLAAIGNPSRYLSALYKRHRRKLGHYKAVMAVAHHLLRVIVTMLQTGETYREQGGDYFDRIHKEQVVARMVNRLQQLGLEVTLREATPVLATVTPAEGAPDGGALGSPPVRSAPPVVPELPAAPVRRRRGRPCKCAERGEECPHQKPPQITPSANASASAVVG